MNMSPRTTNMQTSATKTVSAELVEVRPSGLRVIDRRPSTGSGLTDVFVRRGEGMKPRSTQTASSTNKTTTTTRTVSAELVEVRRSGLRVIDRRPSTGSGLTDVFIGRGLGMKRRSIQIASSTNKTNTTTPIKTKTPTKTVSTEPVEVCLSASQNRSLLVEAMV